MFLPRICAVCRQNGWHLLAMPSSASLSMPGLGRRPQTTLAREGQQNKMKLEAEGKRTRRESKAGQQVQQKALNTGKLVGQRQQPKPTTSSSTFQQKREPSQLGHHLKVNTGKLAGQRQQPKPTSSSSTFQARKEPSLLGHNHNLKVNTGKLIGQRQQRASPQPKLTTTSSSTFQPPSLLGHNLASNIDKLVGQRQQPKPTSSSSTFQPKREPSLLGHNLNLKVNTGKLAGQRQQRTPQPKPTSSSSTFRPKGKPSLLDHNLKASNTGKLAGQRQQPKPTSSSSTFPARKEPSLLGHNHNLVAEHRQRLAANPELQREYAKFAEMERQLDENVFGQLEKERSVEELEAVLGEEPTEREAQKEFEALLLGEDRARDPLNEPDLSEMETGEESASRPVNRFRRQIIVGKEFASSDLSRPPSRANPHPWQPADCPLPPTHARSLAPFANFVPLLQMLVDLGVNIYQARRDDPALGHQLVNHMDLEEAKRKIYWLCKRMGIAEAELGAYLTRNPRFLTEKHITLEHLQAHQNYLTYRRFSLVQGRKLVMEYRYWLNHPIERIDARLGWLQRQFRLKPDEVRLAIVKEPKLIAFGTGPIGGTARSLNNEYGFTAAQLKLLLLRDPRLFLIDLAQVRIAYNYLAFVMRVGNEQLVGCPSAMRCPIWALRRRHEFLFRLRKANYVPDTPGHISLEQFMHPSDRHFAEQVARVPVEDYNRFAKYI